jgi:hypothetical protein
MNTIGDLPHPPKCLEPVKEMLLQKLVYLVVVAKLSAALLNVLNPVATGVLNFGRKTLLNSASLDIGY